MIDIPEGESGPFKVEHFEVSRRDAAMNNCDYCNRFITPGKYTRLVYPGGVMMSDTPIELQDHHIFTYSAKGKVLVTGLGLGCVVDDLLERGNAEHITVIESSEDVLKLCAGRFEGNPKVTIIHADAFTWEPEDELGQFQCCWHDIWPTISADNLPMMVELQERYSMFVMDQLFWCFEQCICAMEEDDDYYESVNEVFFSGKIDEVRDQWDIESGNCCPECETTAYSGDWDGVDCSACQYNADEAEEEEDDGG